MTVAPAAATARICAWCRGAIAETARRDAVTCSKRCRQARHRFVSEVGHGVRVADGHARRLAYADPPYPGKAGYYRDHPDYGGEVDHAELISRLTSTYDAWALSTSARALPQVLALCPSSVRVAAWFRGHRPHATASMPLNAWEPVIYAGQIRRVVPASGESTLEKRPVAEISSDTSRADLGRVALAGEPAALEAVVQVLVDASLVDDRHVALRDTSRGDRGRVEVDVADMSRHPGERVDTLRYFSRPRLTDSGRVIGAKPAAFCRWVFELLGATPDDEFVDVFPGSGGVARAWDIWAGEAS